MAVVGIGGVGSVTAEMLTRCGIGKVVSYGSGLCVLLTPSEWLIKGCDQASLPVDLNWSYYSYYIIHASSYILSLALIQNPKVSTATCLLPDD